MSQQTQTFGLPLGDHALRVRSITAVDSAAEERPTLVFLHDSLGGITVWRDSGLHLERPAR